MKPTIKLRLNSLSLSAWENQGEENKFYTFTIQRSYKDKKDDTWKNTQNLRLDDLPKLKILLDEMYKKLNLKEEVAE